MEFPALNMSVERRVEGFFDPASNTVSYIVKDPSSGAGKIIDSLLDIDYAVGRITYDSADRLIDAIPLRRLTLEWIIETHVHADHLSTAPSGETTIGQQRSDNIQVGGGKAREDLIKFRTERDAQQSMPKLIIPSLRVNMRAGEIPCDDSGKPMLKVPVKGL